MTIENCIVHLIGFPGVGKLTTAKEICANSNFRLIDNHAVNNLFFVTMREDGKTIIPEGVWEKVRSTRQLVFDAIRDHAPLHFNFIFTNALAEEDENERAVAQKLKALADSRGSLYIPVHMLCSPEENKRRIVSPGRELHMKQTHTDDVDDNHQNYHLVETGSPYQFSIEVTDMTAREAAAEILKKVMDINSGTRQILDNESGQ